MATTTTPVAAKSRADDPWELATARFLDDLDPTERDLFKSATLENIYYSTNTLNRDDAKSSKTRFIAKKLGSLVLAIEAYGKGMDVFVQIAPLYLAPIWGAIRVVLVVARAHGKFFDKITEILERIGDVLPRFRDYERIYDRNKHPQLTQALSNAYLDIILVCHDFRRSLRKQKVSTVRRLLKPASTTHEFDSTIERFQKHRANVEDVARHIHMIESAEHRKAELILLAEDRKQKLLAKLSQLDCQHRHRKLRNSRHEGTGIWLTERPEYDEWQASTTTSSILCCYGIPGCGKSVLVSSVVDKLIVAASPLFYYCDYADKRTLEPANVWGTLSKQILGMVNVIPEPLAREIELAEHDGDRLADHLRALDILKHSIELHSGPIYLVFDGIDEVSEASQSAISHGFNLLMATMPIKLFITGREELGSLMQPNNTVPLSRIAISPSTIALDIESYVRASTRQRISTGSLVIQDPSLEDLIVQKLVEGAHGMFLWVEFQLCDLCEPESDHGIKLVLDNLPLSLSETYDRLLGKIKGTERREMIARMFKWIVSARQPLLVDQLREGIAFTLEDLQWSLDKIPTQFDRLVRACGNLVVVGEDTQVVQLAHYTVQQYLLRGEEGPFHFTVKEANVVVGETCVAYLNFTNFDQQVTVYKENMNTDIIVLTNIASQQAFLASDNPGQKIVKLWNTFCGSDRPVVNFDMASHLPRAKLKGSALAKFELLPYVIAHWLWHTIHFDSEPKAKRDEVQVSRRNQLFKELIATKTLLFEFRPWGVFSKDEQYKSSQQLLAWGLMSNHRYLVQMAAMSSIAAGAFGFMEGLPAHPISIFHRAFLYAKDTDKPKAFSPNSIINEPERPCNSWTSDRQWLLDWIVYACQNAHLDTLQWLFMNSDPSAVQGYALQLLIIAATASGHHSILKLLYDVQLDETRRNSMFTPATVILGGHPLHALDLALLLGHEGIAKDLMKEEFKNTVFMDVSIYFEVLAYMVKRGRIDCTEALIRLPKVAKTTYGAHSRQISSALADLPINQKMSDHLVSSIHQGKPDLVWALLRAGVNPDIASEDGSIPLIQAIKCLNDTLVEMLLQHGCNTGPTKFGLPLTLAVSGGDLKIVELLIKTPGLAASQGSSDPAQHAFFSDIWPGLALTRDEEDSVHLLLCPTPLYIAASFGHTAIVKLLIQHGARIDNPSIGRYLRLTLGPHEHPRIARMLRQVPPLNHLPTWNFGSRWDYPIIAALRKGHLETAAVLTDGMKGISPSVIPDMGPDQYDLPVNQKEIETPILTAIAKVPSISGRQLELLIATGASVDEISRDGISLFLWALQRDNSRLERLILQFHPQPADLRLRTLAEAVLASPGYVNIISMLLIWEAENLAFSGEERTSHLALKISSNLRDNTCRDAVIRAVLAVAQGTLPLFYRNTIARSSKFDDYRRIVMAVISVCKYTPLSMETSKQAQELHSTHGGSFKWLLAQLELPVPPTSTIDISPLDFSIFQTIGTHTTIEPNSTVLTRVQDIISKGANVNNVGGPQGASPIIHAADIGASREIITTLCSFGADLVAVDDLEESALHKAVRNSPKNAVSETLECLVSLYRFPMSHVQLDGILSFCLRIDRKEAWICINRRDILSQFRIIVDESEEFWESAWLKERTYFKSRLTNTNFVARSET